MDISVICSVTLTDEEKKKCKEVSDLLFHIMGKAEEANLPFFYLNGKVCDTNSLDDIIIGFDEIGLGF